MTLKDTAGHTPSPIAVQVRIAGAAAHHGEQS